MLVSLQLHCRETHSPPPVLTTTNSCPESFCKIDCHWVSFINILAVIMHAAFEHTIELIEGFHVNGCWSFHLLHCPYFGTLSWLYSFTSQLHSEDLSPLSCKIFHFETLDFSLLIWTHSSLGSFTLHSLNTPLQYTHQPPWLVRLTMEFIWQIAWDSAVPVCRFY